MKPATLASRCRAAARQVLLRPRVQCEVKPCRVLTLKPREAYRKHSRPVPPSLSFNPGRPTTWIGSSPLPTLPIYASHSGRILVISMFAGTEALLIALLAMGINFVAVSVEQDEACRNSVAQSFTNFVQFPDARSVTGHRIVGAGSMVQSFFQIYIASRGVETLVEDLGPTRLAKTGTPFSNLGGVRGT